MGSDRAFGYWKSSIRALHSLHQFRQKKPVQRTSQKYLTWDSAQEQLEKLSIRWDSYTVNQVLKSHPPMEKAWLFFNWASRLKGFKHDQFTYTTMLDIFGEARRIESMNYVFQQMQEKGIKTDAVTYTSLMHWFSNDGDIERAVRVWKEMKAKGCCLNSRFLYCLYEDSIDNKRVKEAADVFIRRCFNLDVLQIVTLTPS
ncbi:Pentatricopeptide repeat-containing protein [Vitis vinifera]|uniref:Pentatricopeptide repeat-containing protein n=1 Tax=Vitis vinifera TaxID=29760 RepID=A0A438CVG9_VITVI|nr:Pentatricopeptide repeat-containing protein [Vitis vinifera]